MLDRIRRTWKPRGDTTPTAIPTSELSLEVQTAIDGAMVIERTAGDPTDGPNVVFMPAGHGGFRYSLTEAERWVREGFPELNEQQVARAVRYIASRVHTHIAEAARARAAENGYVPYSSWRPLSRRFPSE